MKSQHRLYLFVLCVALTLLAPVVLLGAFSIEQCGLPPRANVPRHRRHAFMVIQSIKVPNHTHIFAQTVTIDIRDASNNVTPLRIKDMFLTVNGERAASIEFDESFLPKALHIQMMWTAANYRNQQFSTLLLGMILLRHPDIKSIKATLGHVNHKVYQATRNYELLLPLTIGLSETPFFKTCNKFGFSRVSNISRTETGLINIILTQR